MARDAEAQLEALHLKSLAETSYNNSNLQSAFKQAKRAQSLAPHLDGISEMVTSFEILYLSSKSSLPDWYKILQLQPFAHTNTIRKQYKKLSSFLHPDEKPYVGSQEAFELVNEAFRFLTDKTKRDGYDKKLKIQIQKGAVETGGLNGVESRAGNRKKRSKIDASKGKEIERDSGKRGKLKEKERYLKTDGTSGEWSGRLRSGGLERRRSTTGVVLERSKPERSNAGEEMMTIAEIKAEVKRKLQEEREQSMLREKLEGRRVKKGNEEKACQTSIKSKNLEMEKCGNSKNRVNLAAKEKRGASKKSSALESEEERNSSSGDSEVMAVEDSDFYDFDKDRVERSFKEYQVWALYDDKDGMPRHYGLIDEVVSVNPFEAKMSWLEQNNGAEATLCLEKMGIPLSCGKFKVGKKDTINSLNVFSHIVDCERVSREVYRIYPRKGSVWALYNEESMNAGRSNHAFESKRWYDIVVLLTSYSEIHGLSMAYLVKVDGYKTIFRRQEIGAHAIRWLEKDGIPLFSHEIPARKLSGDEFPEDLNDCWELDPASLPSDLFCIG